MSRPVAILSDAHRRTVIRGGLLAAALGLGLVFVALVVANSSAQKALVRHLEQDSTTLASHERLIAWTTEVHLANLEQELLRLGRSADLKEALAGGDRAALVDQLEPPLNRLRKGPLHVTRISLYTPAGVTRLHAHAPAAPAEEVLGRRPLIAETIRARKILKGLELVDGLPHLLAATPIYHQGRVVGVLELGSPLSPIIRAIQLVTAGRVGVLLGHPARAVEASDPALFAQALPGLRVVAAGTPRQVLSLNEKAYTATLVPLVDFSGRAVARLAILADASGVTEILAWSNAVTFAISLAGLGLAAALLLTLTLYVRSFGEAGRSRSAPAAEPSERVPRVIP